MKPLLLQGHTRSITQIKYNRDGDLLFSASKDPMPSVWFTINGERLGTYNGHKGAVWCIDVDWESRNVLTGSGDFTCKIWDCQTGVNKTTYVQPSSVRTCGFSYSGNLILFTTDNANRKECGLYIHDIRKPDVMSEILKIDITPQYSKITSAIWGPVEETIITGHEDGELMSWDVRTGDLIERVKPHNSQIMDLQHDKDETLIITASKDYTAKLFDIKTLTELKCYKTEKPVNSAAISPINDHIVLGGGQEAVDAALTKKGSFDARFYHLIFEEEFGRVKDHFGPINSVAFHPNGKSYTSGGEDGYVRVHDFDQDYFDFDINFKSYSKK